MKTINSKPWTDAEDNFIKDSIGKMSAEQIGEKLGRTTSSIRNHTRRMLGMSLRVTSKLTPMKDEITEMAKYLPANEIAELIDADLKVLRGFMVNRNIHRISIHHGGNYGVRVRVVKIESNQTFIVQRDAERFKTLELDRPADIEWLDFAYWLSQQPIPSKVVIDNIWFKYQIARYEMDKKVAN
ncbi:hypothetical protein [Latilactobacillus curvatus]|uniref:hypothetical protein n=1 Tax=Latilactobacillus curvatus TaxID=28038 RepID=UPI00223B29B8|nr:hypothetical protein [Latilactobacillus curvatus]MCS8616359.1 hypothetical protein [Latilactobacillus curvatus]